MLTRPGFGLLFSTIPFAPDDLAVTDRPTEPQWESELAQLLEQLGDAQQQLLALLATKGELIRQQDHQGLSELASKEEEIGVQLHACQRRRSELLAAAAAQGLPADSLVELTDALPSGGNHEIRGDLLAARERSQLIRHECLAQWVAVQRTVLHLSQMLEIIATGGRAVPTYGNGQPPTSSGSLMDQAV